MGGKWKWTWEVIYHKESTPTSRIRVGENRNILLYPSSSFEQFSSCTIEPRCDIWFLQPISSITWLRVSVTEMNMSLFLNIYANPYFRSYEEFSPLRTVRRLLESCLTSLQGDLIWNQLVANLCCVDVVTVVECHLRVRSSSSSSPLLFLLQKCPLSHNRMIGIPLPNANNIVVRLGCH